MGTVLQFKPVEDKPDPKHVYVDEDGVTWLEFTARYDLQDGNPSFTLSFWAKDSDHAEEVAAKIRGTLSLLGQLTGEVRT